MAVDQKWSNRPLVAWKMSTVVLNLKNLCFFFSLDHCGAYRLKPGIKKCKSSSYLKCFVIFVQRYTGSSAAVSVTKHIQKTNTTTKTNPPPKNTTAVGTQKYNFAMVCECMWEKEREHDSHVFKCLSWDLLDGEGERCNNDPQCHFHLLLGLCLFDIVFIFSVVHVHKDIEFMFFFQMAESWSLMKILQAKGLS